MEAEDNGLGAGKALGSTWHVLGCDLEGWFFSVATVLGEYIRASALELVGLSVEGHVVTITES